MVKACIWDEKEVHSIKYTKIRIGEITNGKSSKGDFTSPVILESDDGMEVMDCMCGVVCNFTSGSEVCKGRPGISCGTAAEG